eukprot:TRINITY_DN7624_c0_g1_i1.p1 TRINITY_DN7624_c0_g1~~TRINITY_DN7624_c0_g1_i1.p1  ORF type:complete len:135 (-),score=8.89 TRINITY_DN7624_c0_g1_i1:98-502(-)
MQFHRALPASSFHHMSTALHLLLAWRGCHLLFKLHAGGVIVALSSYFRCTSNFNSQCVMSTGLYLLLPWCSLPWLPRISIMQFTLEMRHRCTFIVLQVHSQLQISPRDEHRVVLAAPVVQPAVAAAYFYYAVYT